MALGDDAARCGQAGHQLGCHGFFDPGTDGKLLGLADTGQQLGLGRCGAVGLFVARVGDQFGRFFGDHGLRKSIHIVQRDSGQQLARVGQFVVDAGNGFLLQKVAQVLGGIPRGVGLLTLGIGLLHGAHQALLAAFQFGGRKAQQARAFVLLHQRIDCRHHALTAQHSARAEGAVARHQAAHAAATANKRRCSLLGQLLHAPAQHGAKQVLHHGLAVVAQRAHSLGRLHGVSDQHRVVGGFLVGYDHRFGLAARRERGVQAGPLVVGIFKHAKVSFHQSLGCSGLNVADHRHRHQIGTVPVFVKALDGLVGETLDAFFGADRQALGVQRAAEYLGQQDLVHAVLHSLAQAQLFEHDGALKVDVGVVKADALGPILQHQKTFFDVVGVLGGNGQDVDRLVEAGVGIEVGTELQANGLQVGHQLVFLEISGAIKSHVLHHVGQAQLVLVFQNRPRLDRQA